MGKNVFTVVEAEKIRHLLRRKVHADPAEQKVIRASIRRLGFYISDYTFTAEGFTPSDFDSLVERGEVVITGQFSSKFTEITPTHPHLSIPEIVSRVLPQPNTQAKQKTPSSGLIDFESLEGIKRFGFRGFHYVAHLQGTGCVEAPMVSGVYLVLRTEKGNPEFFKKSVGGFFKGRDPTVSIQELHDNWVDRSIVLNIGKAGGGSSTLRSRLKQYMDFGAGKPVGHRGGRYIWQLAGSDRFQICWMATPNEEPKSVEGRLIHEFKSIYGKRPFANLQD